MIPKIPEEQQLLAVNHGRYKELQKWDYAHDRMVTGSRRYGHSWCEVNLKQDFLEEIADAHNYRILMHLRFDSLNLEMPDKVRQALDDIAVNLADIEYVLAMWVPDFEGPTSTEWVAMDHTEPEKEG